MKNKIQINNQFFAYEKKETILEVAKKNNIYIPTLCWHEKIEPLSRCRLCIVENIENGELVLACATYASTVNKINTKSQKVVRHQKMILSLILSTGNHNCLFCSANGKCELQDLIHYFELPEVDVPQCKTINETDASNPFFQYDSTKCILCGRCVEACNNIVVQNVLSFTERGIKTRISFDQNVKNINSTCVSCGECVQICPVGALTDKKNLTPFRHWDLERKETICGYCGVGCKLAFFVHKKNGKIAYVEGVDTHIVNNGMLCLKGRYGYDFIQSEKRLTMPLLNVKGHFYEIEWEDAIDLIYQKWTHIKKKFGANAIAGLTSAKTTNEDNFVFQKFFRQVIGTNNIDHCARLCHASTVAGLAASLGSGAMTNSIADIENADTIFIIGSDTTSAHPIIANKIKQAVKQNNVKLIVADPKKIEIANLADCYVAHYPGTDVQLLNCIIRYCINKKAYDADFVKQHCEGFHHVKKEVLKDQYDFQTTSEITGVDVDDLIEICTFVATSKRMSVFYAMGITQHSTGTDNVWSLANLQMILGNIGKRGGGINPLRGQSNVQGACDLGGLPNVLPGYVAVNDDKKKKAFERAWNTTIPNEIGLSVTEVFDKAADRKLKSLLIMGENPVLSDPDQTHVLYAIKKLDFFVVQDIFLTETAKLADLVLPSYCFAEKEGHFTNTERRVQRLRPVVSPPKGAKKDWEILTLIAEKFGYQWHYEHESNITDEINALVPTYQAITWNRTETETLQWPCNEMFPNGTEILHENRIVRGKGLLKAISYIPAKETPNVDYPFILTTGRVLQQFHTGTQTRKTPGIEQISKSFVLVNNVDAKALQLENNDRVNVYSRRGKIKINVTISDKIKRGVVFIPFHFAEAPANRLTNKVLDPQSKIPELKVCAVKIEKISLNE